MKAITVRQPWAYAIARLGKNVENRSWAVNYRGPLAVHAGAGWDGDAAQSTVAFTARIGYAAVNPARSQRSAIVAVVDLVDVCCWALDGRGCECGPWAINGQCHWRLANPRPLAEPVPCTGRLGLWDLHPEVEAAVRMQIDPPVQDVRFCRWCNESKPVGHDCPAGAVGCTARQPDETPCGICARCVEVMQSDPRYGSPSDLYAP